MPINDAYGQGYSSLDYGESPDLKLMGEGLLRIVGQTNLRFASATARSAAITSPIEGMRAWLNDSDIETVYNGTAWVTVPKLLMDWTVLGSLGSFSSGYAASTPAPRMRKVNQFGSEIWEYEGRINIPSGLPSATTVTAFTFSALHRPVNGRGFITYNSSHYGTRVTVASDGKLTLSVPSEAGSGVTNVWLDGMRLSTPTA